MLQSKEMQKTERYLQVNIAEGTIGRADHVTESDIFRSTRAQVKGVVKSSVTTGRLIEDSDGIRNDVVAVLALGETEGLPHPPNAVDHGVVYPESRLTRGDEDITT